MKKIAYVAMGLLLTLAACTSGPQDNPPATPTMTLPLVATVAPLLVDQPMAPPACPTDAPLRIPDLQHAWGKYASGCESLGFGRAYLYNLSDQILVVTASQTCFCMQPYFAPDTSSGLPTTDDLSEPVQNYAETVAVRTEGLRSNQVMVPSKGYVVLTPTSHIDVSVDVDLRASGGSYAAKMLVAYVIDNELEALPAAGYYNAVAGCVNAIQNMWDQFSQQNNDSATTLDDALHSVRECRDLQQKLVEDPNEEQHVLATVSAAAKASETESDLNAVAKATDESGWKGELEELVEGGEIPDLLEHAH